MLWSTDITFTCHNMPDDNTYLLPLVMKSEDYDVSQRSAIYILVKLNILQIWVDTDGSAEETKTGKGTITVELNAPINEGQPVAFTVDNTKVEEYNNDNGTSYKTIDPSKIKVTSAEIPAGEQSVEVSYEIDMKDMEYDGEDEYLVPLVLSREGLYTGTEVLDDVIYVSPYKTLEIEYVKTVWGEAEKSNRVTKPEIYHSTLRPSKNAADQQYAINYNQTWADGLIYFNILDETVEGYPNRRKLGDFMDRPYQYPNGCDPLTDNGSWIDMETGVIHFNLTVMDAAYASSGGFPIQIELTPAE